MDFSSSCALFYVGVRVATAKILLCGHIAVEWRYGVLAGTTIAERLLKQL